MVIFSTDSTVSSQADADAHIMLSAAVGRHWDDYNYEVVIAGWTNSKSAIMRTVPFPGLNKKKKKTTQNTLPRIRVN